MTLDDATIDRIAQRLLQILRAERDLTRAPASRPGLVSAEELAVELRVSRKTVQLLGKEGLPVVKVGGQARYDVEEVKAWLKKRSALSSVDASVRQEPPARRLGRRAG